MSYESKVSPRTIASFRKFLKLLPRSEDKELVILKAHLLFEEQIRLIVSERVKNPKAISDAKLSFNGICAVAKSFFHKDHDPKLWESINKINSIRNHIAHNLEPKELEKKLEDLAISYTIWADLEDEISRLEMTLTSMFVSLADLADKPSAQLLETKSSESSDSQVPEANIPKLVQ